MFGIGCFRSHNVRLEFLFYFLFLHFKKNRHGLNPPRVHFCGYIAVFGVGSAHKHSARHGEAHQRKAALDFESEDQ